jgi:hypothetical protein
VQHPHLLRRVSITVDPEYDAAGAAGYARDHGTATSAGCS